MFLFLDYKKAIPDAYYHSIFDIDFANLYKSGKRYIFIDLDNTLISYKEIYPKEETFKFKEMVEKIGFKLIIVSNNKPKRVKIFSERLGVKYFSYSLKPLKRGFNKALKECNANPREVVEIGDQLLTDVYGSKRVPFYTILVDAVDHKTEKLITRINRLREKFILKKIKKNSPYEYELKLKKYEEINL
jgi:HAD superfamily phosphatase (TIGR01668 family)